MAQLRRNYHEFVKRDAEVIAIGPENAKDFSAFWEAKNMPFPGIPDPQHKIADKYGQEVNLVKLGRMPAMLVVDKNGVIRYKHFGESMSDIPEDDEVLEVLDKINSGEVK
jgi:peroxiredoxin